MIVKLLVAVFAPKHPKFYSGRHRAPMWFRATTSHDLPGVGPRGVESMIENRGVPQPA
jgi:hypothetical protein